MLDALRVAFVGGSGAGDGWADVAAIVVLVIVGLEVAYLLVAAIGRPGARHKYRAEGARLPVVSCIITCYSEGADIKRTVRSLLEQDYAGIIEIMPVIDGAARNRDTLQAAESMRAEVGRCVGRVLRVLPKWPRGGRSSSLNAGLALAAGEIVMALDGDTSFDRDMVRNAVARFNDKRLVVLAGTLRVRNAGVNLLTRLQALDYLIYRQVVRAGLGACNLINNIPGAHGIFRADFLRAVGGWDTGAAEDVDLSLRVRKYLGRYPGLKVGADERVVSRTDVPDRWVPFLRQRLRWEGDPAYLHFRKHGSTIRPAVMGRRSFLFTVWYGVIYQQVMPILLLVALLMLLLSSRAGAVLGVAGAAYILYFLATLAALGVHMVRTDMRWSEERQVLLMLPLYPFYILLMRLWSAAAVLHSLLLRSHLDTTMAPWWVLRKGKF